MLESMPRVRYVLSLLSHPYITSVQKKKGYSQNAVRLAPSLKLAGWINSQAAEGHPSGIPLSKLTPRHRSEAILEVATVLLLPKHQLLDKQAPITLVGSYYEGDDLYLQSQVTGFRIGVSAIIKFDKPLDFVRLGV
jgi:hypothetical protein